MSQAGRSDAGVPPVRTSIDSPSFLDRVYADFLLPSRLDAYRRLLVSALEAGYRTWSLERFWRAIQTDSYDPGLRHLVLRHDVDTDAGTARSFWEIERDLGVVASYYFRLSTLDHRLMLEMSGSGSEASYHYEELATVARQYRLHTAEQTLDHMTEARDLFRRNLRRLRDRTGLAMRVVASHGHFINRDLGLANWALLSDHGFREELGVDLEAYDDALMRHVTSRHSDALHPNYWIPEDPGLAIARREPVIYLLTHPRVWHADRLHNLRDDVGRLAESVVYRLPAWPSRGSRA
jgi:hypothetical protein